MEVDDLFDGAADGSFVISVHAQPGASSSGVVGRHGAALKVRVSAPPDKGRANAALAGVLATALGVAPSQVTLVSGTTNRAKRFRVTGCTRDELARRLRELVDG